MTETIVLDLDKLNLALPYMRKSLLDYIYDAAVFLLHYHRHFTGLQCEVRSQDEDTDSATLVWTRQYTQRLKNTFGGTDYAVEFAAEGIACLTIQAFTKFTVIERSLRNDGVDFWLGESRDEDDLVFRRAARMESKGITEARYPSDIKSTLDRGIEQSKQSDDTRLPAFIIVTEFSKPVVIMVQR